MDRGDEARLAGGRDGNWDGDGRTGWERLREEPVVEEAGVPLTAFRVEDPELRSPPGRTEPIAGDRDLCPLPDDIPSEPDPRSTSQLQAHPRRLGDRMRHGRGEPRRLEDDKQGLGAPGEGDQSTETILEGRTAKARVQSRRQVDDEQVHRPGREESAGQGQAVGQRPGGEDHQPLQPDPTGDRLDRVERSGEIQPGHDRARGLGLRGESQGEGGPAAGGVAAQGHACGSGQAAGPEDGIEGREPGRDDLAREALSRCERGRLSRTGHVSRAGHVSRTW